MYLGKAVEQAPKDRALRARRAIRTRARCSRARRASTRRAPPAAPVLIGRAAVAARRRRQRLRVPHALPARAGRVARRGAAARGRRRRPVGRLRAQGRDRLSRRAAALIGRLSDTAEGSRGRDADGRGAPRCSQARAPRSRTGTRRHGASRRKRPAGPSALPVAGDADRAAVRQHEAGDVERVRARMLAAAGRRPRRRCCGRRSCRGDRSARPARRAAGAPAAARCGVPTVRARRRPGTRARMAARPASASP